MTTADGTLPAIETPAGETMEALRTRAAQLEQQVRALGEQSRANLIRAELKAEALRAGMVDLDGLKLIDPAELSLTESGEVEGAAALIQRFRRAKPWLFASGSSAIAAAPPPSRPPRQKAALEMSHDEYRIARAALLRRL
jgi:hypothetical protein